MNLTTTIEAPAKGNYCFPPAPVTASASLDGPPSFIQQCAAVFTPRVRTKAADLRSGPVDRAAAAKLWPLTQAALSPSAPLIHYCADPFAPSPSIPERGRDK